MTTKRVLVIDDEEAVQEVIQGCLEDVGEWETLLAGSRSAGIRLATDEVPDAILLDVSMPEIDGVETFRRLQAHPATKNIPVILLTAKVQPVDRMRFAELGIAGVIAKPFNPMTLVDLVAEVLGWELHDES